MITLTTPQLTQLAIRSHHFARLWELQRMDGFTIRVTDHDAELTFNGKTFSPLGGFNASATQRQAGLKSRNFEIVGVLESDLITHADLRAGLYHNAKVTCWIVDWNNLELGAYRKDVAWIQRIKYTGDEFEAEVEGLTSWLSRPVGKTYTRTCRHRLGDSICRVNFDAVSPLGYNLKADGTVTGADPKRRTFAGGLDSFPDGWFAMGRIVWTGGENAGITSEVKYFVDGRITLIEDTPWDIAVGDTFTAYAGCLGTINWCKDKFNNVANFGGFPSIPGNDVLWKAARKQGG